MLSLKKNQEGKAESITVREYMYINTLRCMYNVN